MARSGFVIEQKRMERLYMKGGLAACYPDVYGPRGIWEQSGRRDMPADRFEPAPDYKPYWNPPYSGWSKHSG